jgi:hypothetical protein
MANRTITDADGREWTCVPVVGTKQTQGRDVVLTCTTPTVDQPVRLTVGWQWEKMAAKGLARLIVLAEEDARRAA